MSELNTVFAVAKFLSANEAAIREVVNELAAPESTLTKIVEVLPQAIALVKAAQEAGLVPTK